MYLIVRCLELFGHNLLIRLSQGKCSDQAFIHTSFVAQRCRISAALTVHRSRLFPLLFPLLIWTTVSFTLCFTCSSDHWAEARPQSKRLMCECDTPLLFAIFLSDAWDFLCAKTVFAEGNFLIVKNKISTFWAFVLDKKNVTQGGTAQTDLSRPMF